MLVLNSDEIHLWLADYDEICSDAIQTRYRALLNVEERNQEPRFRYARDRQRYLVTRVLVRTVLSRYEPIDPMDWTFSKNAYGRPEIANEGPSCAGLSFNVSHTHSLIVLGVARYRAIGVDVENVSARDVSLGIAEHFFARTEVAELAMLPADRRRERFFEYWTFKESYIKARGMGLSLPLDKFSFAYPHERAVQIAFDAEFEDVPTRWLFWQLQPSPEYLVAMCAERVGSSPPTIVVRKSLPMVDEEILAPTLRRTSS